MNYLFRFLSTLLPEEVERLGDLDITPREREVLDLLLAMRATPEATKEEAMERLGMSGSMFDKSCSTLLRSALVRAIEGGESKLLEHLARRGVSDLFLHELGRREKACLASGDREAAARFYGEAFRVLHRYFSSNYPERLARRMATKYRRLVPGADTTVLTEAFLARTAVLIEASRRTGDAAALKRLERRLIRNDERIDAVTGPQARFAQLAAWITWYGQLKRNPERRMECLRASAELCERYPEIFTLDDKVRTLCQIAEEHYFYHTDLVTPLEMYRSLYEQYPDVLRHEEYHTFKFIQLCLINGAYQDAERLLLAYFGARANMVVHGGGRSKVVALLWTKLLVLTDRLEEARRHLDDAVELNQKGFYLQFEVECRMLHTTICYLEGDFDTVELRLPAHIKFLRSKGATYKASRYYPWFFRLAGAFIDERTTGKRLPAKLERKLEEYSEGAAALFGALLWKMRRS